MHNHKDLIINMPKIQEGVASCVPTFVPRAAIDVLNGPQDTVSDRLEDYQRRRDILIDGLNKISGIKCIKISGAFYAFPNVKIFGKTSLEFVKELLIEAGVIATPGSAFGEMGEGYLRMSFATFDENLKEGVRRIANHAKKKY